MSTRNRIPSALEPYLRLPPKTSLVLLTGTVGCSPNWLAACSVSSILSRKHDISSGDDVGGAEPAVILISWMRDLTFWKTETRRTTGIDISKPTENGRFVFIDCLAAHSLSSGHNPLGELEKAILNAIEKTQKPSSRQVVLVLDSPDVLLSMSSTTAQQLNHCIFKLRSSVHSAVLSCSADLPLLATATKSAENKSLPIEVEAARFITQQAHNARYVMSVRELDTGAARDVSGVLRITRSGCAYDLDDAEQVEVREMEALYLVQRDGSVKVFERGADAT